MKRFWWSASITLNNNNDVLTDFFSLYTLPHTSVGLTSYISIVFFTLNFVYPYDHYAAFSVALNLISLSPRSDGVKTGIKITPEDKKRKYFEDNCVKLA